MVSIKDKDVIKEVYTFLSELSCCLRCIIRYLGVYVMENEGAYKTPEQFLLQFEINVIKNADNETAKKFKKNCCPACLNSFDEVQIEKIVERISQTDINEYNYNTYMLNISFPKCFLLRTYSILLHLHKKFPLVPLFNVKRNEEPAVEHPYKILRCVSSKIFGHVLNKDYSPKSNLMILIVLGYHNDNSEVEKLEPPPLKKLSKKKMRYIKPKPRLPVSRNEIFEIVKNINSEQFTKYYPIPPEIPDKGVFVESVAIQTDPIFIGGRYLKFKRNVGQTPWIVDGVSLSEHNMQEIIFNAVEKISGINKSNMTFTASGREDVDVRMLGQGRPFYIKIDKSKSLRISDVDLLKIQEEIIKTDLVAVIKLQNVYASDINRIKSGEADKRKTYVALCHTQAPNISGVVDLINKISNGVDIVQTTALRVLHRRTLMDRTRSIYKLQAKAIEGQEKLFELEVVTQAGTYVKEFVHGDFGRTVPSISSIVGYPTDIIALDCNDIHLEWPEDGTNKVKQPNAEKIKIEDGDIEKKVENDNGLCGT